MAARTPTPTADPTPDPTPAAEAEPTPAAAPAFGSDAAWTSVQADLAYFRATYPEAAEELRLFLGRGAALVGMKQTANLYRGRGGRA